MAQKGAQILYKPFSTVGKQGNLNFSLIILNKLKTY